MQRVAYGLTVCLFAVKVFGAEAGGDYGIPSVASSDARVSNTAAVSATAAASYQGEEVVVRGRAVNLVGIADSASQGRVDAEDLSRRPLLRPAEVLEAVPGLLVTQHSGDGKANQYFTRGFNLDHGTDFAFHVDGVPVNMVSHAHAEGYTDLNFLIPELVKEVDYRKGPYNVEVGDFATAGSANFVYPYILPHTLAQLTLGEFGYQRGLFAGSALLPVGQVLYAFEGGGYDGPWDVPEAFKKYNGLLRYSIGTLANGFSLTAGDYQASWQATNQIPQRAVDEGLIGTFGSLDPSDGGNSRRASVWAQWQRHTSDSESQAVAYVTVSHLQLWNNFTFFLEDPAQGDQHEQVDERTVSGFRAHHTLSATVFGMPLSQEFGLDARNDNITTLALYHTVQRTPLGTVQNNQAVERSVGPYYGATLQALPGLRLEAGYRHDFFRMDVEGLDPATRGQATAGVDEPKAGLAWKLSEALELYGNYGWGFHSNDSRIITPRSLGSLSSQATTDPLALAKGMELGARYGVGEAFQSTLAVWQLHLDSELTFDGDAAASGASSPSTRQGVEWSNSFHWRPFFADLDYAFSQARFDTEDTVDQPTHPGTYVPEALEQVWSATLGTDPIGGWSADVRLRYFGARALVADNSVRSNAMLEAGARATYRWNASQSVHLDIFNLLDDRDYDVSYYYTSRLQGEPLAGVEDIHGHPEEPRSVRVTWVSRF